MSFYVQLQAQDSMSPSQSAEAIIIIFNLFQILFRFAVYSPHCILSLTKVYIGETPSLIPFQT